MEANNRQAAADTLPWTIIGASGAFRLGRRVHRRAVPVLTYHQVRPDGDWKTGPRHPNVVSVSEFESQIAYLARWYRIVSGAEFESYLAGRTELPPHAVLITFDDGYRDNFSEVLPVLQRHGATAVFFVTTDFVGARTNRLWLHQFDALVAGADESHVAQWQQTRGLPPKLGQIAEFRAWAKRLPRDRRDDLLRDLRDAFGQSMKPSPDEYQPMTWDEVAAMAAAGMTIGSHTVSHQIVGFATRDQVRQEMRASREELETRLQRPCKFFSYPNGEASDFGPADMQEAQAAGYSCAFSQVTGFVKPGSHPFALPRIPVPASANFDVFLSRLSGVYGWLHSMRASVNA